MTLVWVTRALPSAEGTARRVRALGLQAVIAPLIQIRTLSGGPIDLTGVGALAFTSANAVTAFAERSFERSLPVFAVGDATAAAARAAGFASVRSAGGDVAALAEAIAPFKGSFKGVVLHPAAAQPAGDLVAALASRDVEARAITVYETRPAKLRPDILAMIPRMDVALLHSPRAAGVLARLLRRRPSAGLIALCLSPAVAAPLAASAGLARVQVAPLPSEEALLHLLSDLRGGA
jgi:uroporphyrinogen-III synthase